MSQRLFAAASFAACLLLVRESIAQDVFELTDTNTGASSTATIGARKLDVFSNGVLYRYLREPRFDMRGFDAYYNTTLAQVLAWPKSNQGRLRVGTKNATGFSFRWTNMKIASRRGGQRPIQQGQPQPQPKAQPTVVVESAVQAGTLVAALRYGGGAGGNVEIGGEEAQDLRHQFTLQATGAGYFRIIPAAHPRMIVDIQNGRAAANANVHLWVPDKIDPQAAQFRFIPAQDGYVMIETKLRPGFVWDIEGNNALAGSSIRLMPRTGAASQLFRVASPEDAMRRRRRGRSRGVGGPVVPAAPMSVVEPLASVKVKLANTQRNELWVQVVDRRLPGMPQRLKIKPNEALTLELDRDPLAVLYEVSVYELIRQSVVIDRTPRGAGKVTDENFSPKSVGWFEIPAGKQQSSGLIDVYRLAASGRNPGGVAVIEPSLWEDVIADEVSTPTTSGAPASSGTGEGYSDPDSPFGVAGGVDAGTLAPGVEATDLDLHLSADEDQSGAPHGQLNLSLARLNNAGDLTIERMIWQMKPVMYEVTVPYTETVLVDGKERTVAKMRTETRTRTEADLLTAAESLPLDQVEAYRTDGSRLNAKELANELKKQTVVVWLEGDEQLDAQYLPLLSSATLVLYAPQGPPWQGGPVENQRKEEFPSTAIEFCGALQSADGEMLLARPFQELVEQSYIVQVPIVEQKEVDGKLVDVTTYVSETRSRTVTVRRVQQTPIAPEAFRLYEMTGKRLTAQEIGDRLATPQTVIHVAEGKKLDQWYRRAFKAGTLLISERAPK